MATRNTDTISITLKNGQCFEHHPPCETPEKQLKFMNEILAGWTKPGGGILMLTYPVALYNLQDVSSIHFPDMVKSADTPTIGFHPNKLKN
jgi:hypothetical protein